MFLSGVLPPAPSLHLCSLSDSCEAWNSLLPLRLPEHIRSSLTRCAQVAHPLRNFGPKTVRKLMQPKTLCRLPLYLDQLGVATPLTCVRGFRLAAKAREEDSL